MNPLFFCYLLVACFWGGSFVAIKVVVGNMPPMLAAALRVAIAGVAIYVYYRGQGKNLSIPKESRKMVWTAGLFAQGVPFAFLFWGEKSISAGLAGILNGTTPIWTFLLGLFFLRRLETFTSRKFLGVLIGLMGVCTIFWPMLQIGKTNQELLGTLAVWAMSLCYAIATLMGRKILAKGSNITFEANVFQQTVVSAVFLFIVAILTEGVSFHGLAAIPAVSWLAILYMAVCSTAFGWIVYFKLIQSWGVIRASSIGYLVPMVSLVGDFLVFGRVPDFSQMIGIIFILGGVLLIQMPSRKKSLSSTVIASR